MAEAAVALSYPEPERQGKFLGLWLLTVERSQGGDDWRSFYERWEVAGRQLEHIFLARIRYAPINLYLSSETDTSFSETLPPCILYRSA